MLMSSVTMVWRVADANHTLTSKVINYCNNWLRFVLLDAACYCRDHLFKYLAYLSFMHFSFIPPIYNVHSLPVSFAFIRWSLILFYVLFIVLLSLTLNWMRMACLSLTRMTRNAVIREKKNKNRSSVCVNVIGHRLYAKIFRMPETRDPQYLYIW